MAVYGAANGDDQPVEDLVNAPPSVSVATQTLELNTNKGKLVVTATTDGTQLQSVVLEKKFSAATIEPVAKATSQIVRVRLF